MMKRQLAPEGKTACPLGGRRKTFKAWICFIVLCVSSYALAAEFVTVKGTKFYLGDEPYYFSGTNFWYGCYLGQTEEGRERLVRELDRLQEIGITNLRVLGASEESDIERSVRPALQSAPGVYDTSLLKGLDILLAEMKARDIRAVIFLNNYWEWSGGMSSYMDWFSDEPVIDPGATGNWNGFMQYSAKFYRNDEALKAFRAYVNTIVLRRNTITGRLYKDDPTIMAWELANEPRPGPDGPDGQKNIDVFLDWIHGTAQYIKSLDSRHLVSTGSEGLHGCLYDPDLFVSTHDGPYIDYASLHLWPKNWGWFRANRIDVTLPTSIENAKAYLNRHVPLAQRIGKPLVLGEFGMDRDNGGLDPNSPSTARDQFLTAMYEFVYENALAGGPYAGSNVWGWGGEGRAQRPDGRWQPGEPFTADPPQEAQGLNSIFDEDSSTIEILKQHAQQMQSLNRKETAVP